MNSLNKALDLLQSGGYAIGDEWHRAHDIAQSHEGEVLFDRLHALIHRIEGDRWNAGYWYRRAGVEPFTGPFDEEAAAIRSALGD